MNELLDLLENNKPLTNFDISKICKDLNIPLDTVAMNNQFEFNWLSKDFSIILNLEDTDSKGTHWVAFYNQVKSNEIFYMDSYGEVCNAKPYKMIEEKDINLFFNKKQFQAMGSVMCGWFCIYFLYVMNTNPNKIHSIMEFLQLFNYKDFKKNDDKIKILFKKLIKQKLKKIRKIKK